ncbi:maleylpyruvate isomerase family mycothiol-dependent enzyme [Aeromicrobium sp. 9AM]|uniref:maleylpyruvate isomerase family mycothiol-dependent enzyme n=1 Tax=Aeromicrobium sp. 9AM TaxID=2653126 RepID=UPI0012F1A192|nr:maleylpyruvate isomerase family mycothiol-dependent enzyme [Aeromicrobium sp. 9AM]VXB88636.1 conserved hypothetical protein [Aeromicrobium sp. 9AM]
MTATQIDLLESVLRTTRRLADRLEPRDLERPTPCDELDVRRLLEHLIGWQQIMGACAAGLEPALADGSPTYVASADIAGDLRAASTALVNSLRQRNDDTIVLPYRGSTSVDVMHAEQLAEHVIHTWDLGAALGVPVSFDEEVVTAAHEGLSLMLGESFAEMGFRTPVSAQPAPTELARLLVRSGRSPADWPTP